MKGSSFKSMIRFNVKENLDTYYAISIIEAFRFCFLSGFTYDKDEKVCISLKNLRKVCFGVYYSTVLLFIWKLNLK